MKHISRNTLLRLILTFALTGLMAGMITDIQARFSTQLRGSISSYPHTFFIAVVFLLVFTLAILAQTWFPERLGRMRHWRARLRWTRWVLILLIGLLVNWFFLYSPWSDVFKGVYLRGSIYLAALGMMSWLTVRSSESSFEWMGFLAATILLGSTFAFEQAFQYVSSYPFSQFWSEGNRLWDYSMFYGRWLYIYPADQPIRVYLERGRQSLWGLPFLIPGVTILAVRLWSALVFTVPYMFLGWFSFRHQKGQLAAWLMLGLWTFLFLNQGPIYSTLVLAAILVMATRKMRLVPAILLIFLAGYYARFSRLTWMFAPGLWAGMMAFLEAGSESSNAGAYVCVVRRLFGRNTRLMRFLENPDNFLRTQQWMRAILLGISGLMGGYIVPVLLNSVKFMRGILPTSSFVLSVQSIDYMVDWQPLLWERLWPSTTYPTGVALGLLLAAGPLVILLGYLVLRRTWRLDRWQIVAILGVQTAFLVVGVIASVKIGGGSNLHNLDMFLIGLVCLAAIDWEAGGWELVNRPEKNPIWVSLLVVWVVLYPAMQGVLSAAAVDTKGRDQADQAMKNIINEVEIAKTKGEVLFIDQRQLLTFGYIKGVPLVPEYEKKYMMDLAMANNANYFAKFYTDLSKHRFSLIISEVLQTYVQGEASIFGYENDAWVKWVSNPVLCYYYPIQTYEFANVQILSPRSAPLNDSNIKCPVVVN